MITIQNNLIRDNHKVSNKTKTDGLFPVENSEMQCVKIERTIQDDNDELNK